jgi:hypothetical protein
LQSQTAEPETHHRTPPALDTTADERLARVTPVTVRGEPLGALLRALSQQTGVRLDASREVAELKVTLLARDLTLSRLLAEVAALLDLSWNRRGAAPAYRYECTRSPEASQRSRAALEQARAAHRAAVQAQIERMVEAFQSGDLGPLRLSDPTLAGDLEDIFPWMDRKVLRALGETIAKGVPPLVRTSDVTTPFKELPRPIQDTIRNAAASVLPLSLGEIRGPDGNSPGYEAALQSANFQMGLKGMEYGDTRYFFALSIPGLPVSTTLRLETHPDLPEVLPATPSPAEKLAAEAAAATGGGRSASRRRRLSNPSHPRREGIVLMSVREVADWLAEKGSFAVVCDYYLTGYERPVVPVPVRSAPEAALAAMEEFAEMDHALSPDRRVLRLRSRRWTLDDLIEPPAAVVDALETSLKTRGRLGLADYVLAAQLDAARQFGLALAAPSKFEDLRRKLQTESEGLLGDMLRLTAALTTSQRAAAESAAGLPAIQFTGEQKARFLEMARRRVADLTEREAASATFHIQPEGHAGTDEALPGRAVFSVAFPERPPLSIALPLGG